MSQSNHRQRASGQGLVQNPGRRTHAAKCESVCTAPPVVPVTHALVGEKVVLTSVALSRLNEHYNDARWDEVARKTRERLELFGKLVNASLVRPSLIAHLHNATQASDSMRVERVIDLIEHDALSRVYRYIAGQLKPLMNALLAVAPELEYHYRQYTKNGLFSLSLETYEGAEVWYCSNDHFRHLFCELDKLQGSDEADRLRIATFAVLQKIMRYGDGCMPHFFFEWNCQMDVFYQKDDIDFDYQALKQAISDYESDHPKGLLTLADMIFESPLLYDNLLVSICEYDGYTDDDLNTWKSEVKAVTEEGKAIEPNEEITIRVLEMAKYGAYQSEYAALFYNELETSAQIKRSLEGIEHPLCDVLKAVLDLEEGLDEGHIEGFDMGEECIGASAFCICPVSDETALGSAISEWHERMHEHMMQAGEDAEYYTIDPDNPAWVDYLAIRTQRNSLIWFLGTAATHFAKADLRREIPLAA